MFYISCDKEIPISELMNLLKQTYWATERTEGDARKSLQHSVNFGAFDEKNCLIGFARVVTDFVSMYYICDVIVDEKHRGNGIGKALVEAIVNDKRFTTLSGLLKTKDAHGLYNQYDFKDVDPHRVMYRSPEN